MNKCYLEDLSHLEKVMTSVPATPYVTFSKIISLVTLNMRYEAMAFDGGVDDHPYILTSELIRDSISHFQMLVDIDFIESEKRSINQYKSSNVEEKHLELWQEIWTRLNQEEFREFVDLKKMRFEINGITPLINGSDCVDLGCGNGVISLALLEIGANSVAGIDYGAKSIAYANNWVDGLGHRGRAEFRVGNLLDTGYDSDSFDFCVSNGVFHHLNREDLPLAITEVTRVLRNGGWFWYYIDGSGAINNDLWNATVKILADVAVQTIESVLNIMNVSRNKMIHIVDSTSATYYHSDYDEVIADLSQAGFGEFRRMKGGDVLDSAYDQMIFGTDDTHNTTDPYALEKFGTGPIRIVCKLLG